MRLLNDLIDKDTTLTVLRQMFEVEDATSGGTPIHIINMNENAPKCVACPRDGIKCVGCGDRAIIEFKGRIPVVDLRSGMLESRRYRSTLLQLASILPAETMINFDARDTIWIGAKSWSSVSEYDVYFVLLADDALQVPEWIFRDVVNTIVFGAIQQEAARV